MHLNFYSKPISLPHLVALWPWASYASVPSLWNVDDVTPHRVSVKNGWSNCSLNVRHYCHPGANLGMPGSVSQEHGLTVHNLAPYLWWPFSLALWSNSWTFHNLLKVHSGRKSFHTCITHTHLFVCNIGHHIHRPTFWNEIFKNSCHQTKWNGWLLRNVDASLW